MKKIIYSLPLVALFAVTSCNKSTTKINRIHFKNEVASNEIPNRIEAIKNKQIVDDVYNLMNESSVTFKYNAAANGYMRYAGFSVDQLSLALNGFVKMSWNLEKNYLKMEGPKETAYVIKDNDTWYVASAYQEGNVVKKEKFIESSMGDDFKGYVINQCERNLSIGVEIKFSISEIVIFSRVIKFGIYGMTDPILSESLTPQYFFADNHMREVISGLANLYKDNKKGYYLNENYTSDDASNLTCNVKTNINLEDMKKVDTGYDNVAGKANLDFFSAWKDNYAYQNELIFNSDIVIKDKGTTNLHANCYLSEEVQSTCKIDKVNLDDYQLVPAPPEPF